MSRKTANKETAQQTSRAARRAFDRAQKFTDDQGDFPVTVTVRLSPEEYSEAMNLARAEGLTLDRVLEWCLYYGAEVGNCARKYTRMEKEGQAA